MKPPKLPGRGADDGYAGAKAADLPLGSAREPSPRRRTSGTTTPSTPSAGGSQGGLGSTRGSLGPSRPSTGRSSDGSSGEGALSEKQAMMAKGYLAVEDYG